MTLSDDEKKAKHAEYMRAYRGKTSEKVKAAHRAYYHANREKEMAKHRAWVQKNREKVLAYARDYAQKNRDAVREKARVYRETNREKVLARERAYRENNPEKVASATKKWVDANREKYLAIGRAYREANREELVAKKTSRRRAAGVKPMVRLTPEQKKERAREAARKRAHAQVNLTTRWDVLKIGYCQVCGARASNGAELHVDHITPVSRGGSSDRSNLQALCAPCNLGKSDHYEAV